MASGLASLLCWHMLRPLLSLTVDARVLLSRLPLLINACQRAAWFRHKLRVASPNQPLNDAVLSRLPTVAAVRVSFTEKSRSLSPTPGKEVMFSE